MTDPTPDDPSPWDARLEEPAYLKWLDALEEIAGEVTIYASHWRELYDLGLTPAKAWDATKAGYANSRKDGGKYAPILDGTLGNDR